MKNISKFAILCLFALIQLCYSTDTLFQTYNITLPGNIYPVQLGVNDTIYAYCQGLQSDVRLHLYMNGSDFINNSDIISYSLYDNSTSGVVLTYNSVLNGTYYIRVLYTLDIPHSFKLKISINGVHSKTIYDTVINSYFPFVVKSFLTNDNCLMRLQYSGPNTTITIYSPSNLNIYSPDYHTNYGQSSLIFYVTTNGTWYLAVNHSMYQATALKEATIKLYTIITPLSNTSCTNFCTGKQFATSLAQGTQYICQCSASIWDPIIQMCIFDCNSIVNSIGPSTNLGECLCNTGYIWSSGTLTCSKLCGNGVKDSDQQCDDGNTNNSDGCSDACKNESESGLSVATIGIIIGSVVGGAAVLLIIMSIIMKWCKTGSVGQQIENVSTAYIKEPARNTGTIEVEYY